MNTEAKIWKEGESYKKEETVFYENCQYVAKRDIDLATYSPSRSENWTYIEPKWEITNSVEKQLLTEICKDAFTCICDDYHKSPWVPKLKYWWEHNKPKSDREIKLEKIKNIIYQNIKVTVEQQAEEILKLLGE